LSLLASVAACGDDDPITDSPDGGAVETFDASPGAPDAAPQKSYGEVCTDATECLGGFCIGYEGEDYTCSRGCDINTANSCKTVDAFCVPVTDSYACFGEIETGNDGDDAIIAVGDAVTRGLTPLDDADLFQVHLDELGDILFQVTTDSGIDMQLEAYGVLGDPLGVANVGGAGEFEALQTEVQQIGGYIFMVVRNVGTSTGSYTLEVIEMDD
jgi:hypothetical protein